MCLWLRYWGTPATRIGPQGHFECFFFCFSGHPALFSGRPAHSGAQLHMSRSPQNCSSTSKVVYMSYVISMQDIAAQSRPWESFLMGFSFFGTSRNKVVFGTPCIPRSGAPLQKYEYISDAMCTRRKLHRVCLWQPPVTRRGQYDGVYVFGTFHPALFSGHPRFINIGIAASNVKTKGVIRLEQPGTGLEKYG